MAVENTTATRRNTSGQWPSPGMGGSIKCEPTTIEVTAAASATSTYNMGRVPSNARWVDLTKVYFDDLATTGSPTFTISVRNVNGGVALTTIRSGIDVAAAAGSALLIADIANYGKRVWELAGLASDPEVALDVIITLVAAATDTGGTVTFMNYYFVD